MTDRVALPRIGLALVTNPMRLADSCPISTPHRVIHTDKSHIRCWSPARLTKHRTLDLTPFTGVTSNTILTRLTRLTKLTVDRAQPDICLSVIANVV
jgi:hypothetical protein